MMPLHLQVPEEMRRKIIGLADDGGLSIGQTVRELLVEGMRARGLA